MSRPEVTFGFYSGEYGGALGEDGFAAALPRAEACVGAIVWPNDPMGDEDAYRRAVCAACDVESAYGCTGGAGGLSSVTAGSASIGFGGDGAGSRYSADMAAAARRELAGSGLLYMGLG